MSQDRLTPAFNELLRNGKSFSGHERNCCFLNTGPGARGFADTSAISGLDYEDDGRALAKVDWDQDGDSDLWISNRNAPRLRFLRNDLPRSNHFLSVRLEGNGTTTNRDIVPWELNLNNREICGLRVPVSKRGGRVRAI